MALGFCTGETRGKWKEGKQDSFTYSQTRLKRLVDVWVYAYFSVGDEKNECDPVTFHQELQARKYLDHSALKVTQSVLWDVQQRDNSQGLAELAK